ncbi:Pol protein [Phytophthora palmivora]|uniref:Pol protein n=1 Tax=Phytophthora palmivora TaxID=4796 RepID=A0A2P4X090_9STRA|nr:Pol protein [Phytophthora palmivora]
MSAGKAFGSPPPQSLPVPADCWKSMSLDFAFGLPADDKGNTGILVFVCRLSKMVLLVLVCDKVTGKQAARLFLDSVFRYHGLSETIVSDRDPRATAAFWSTRSRFMEPLRMSTGDHPQTDGQTERVNRMLDICAEAPRSWSDKLPMVEFALNNAVRKAFSSQGSEIEAESLKRQLSSFIYDRLTLISPVRNAMTLAHDKQKEYSVKRSRGIFNVFKSMATLPAFYVGRLKRYHDPLGPSSRTEEGQGERSPPRNEAESSGQPELPNLWKPEDRLRVDNPKAVEIWDKKQQPGVSSPRLLSCLTVYGPWVDGTVPALILSAGLRLLSKSLRYGVELPLSD